MSRWISALAISAVVTAAAVLIQSPLFPGVFPHALRRFAEIVASPGEFMWWVTVGGVFSGRPTGLSGYVVWILGSTAVWFAPVWALSAMVRLVQRLVADGNR